MAGCTKGPADPSAVATPAPAKDVQQHLGVLPDENILERLSANLTGNGHTRHRFFVKSAMSKLHSRQERQSIGWFKNAARKKSSHYP